MLDYLKHHVASLFLIIPLSTQPLDNVMACSPCSMQEYVLPLCQSWSLVSLSAMTEVECVTSSNKCSVVCSSSYMDDLWCFDVETKEWRQLEPLGVRPSARAFMGESANSAVIAGALACSSVCDTAHFLHAPSQLASKVILLCEDRGFQLVTDL